MLGTASCYGKNDGKKPSEDEGMRNLFFGCDKQIQMEAWVITIEYLRTRAVYEAYAQKNIPVEFPIKSSVVKKQH